MIQPAAASAITDAQGDSTTPRAAAKKRVLVTGGSGFVGRHVVAKLSAAGHDVVVLTRKRDRARPLFLLPTVQVREGDAQDRPTLVRLLRNADVAINLVGILHARGRETFERVHVAFVRTWIDACREAGVDRVIHMSAQGASADAASEYLRTKAAGEAIVTASGLAWTIFRPSVIFGPGDTFLNLFARLATKFPVIPLACAGACFQPVYVGDVAACFARAVVDDATIRKHYSLCGPTAYTLEELVRYVADTSGNPRPILPLGLGLARLQARVLELLPGPLLTRDNLASMQHDNVCEGPFPPEFDITPAPLEAIVPEYLAPVSLRNRFDIFRARDSQ